MEKKNILKLVLTLLIICIAVFVCYKYNLLKDFKIEMVQQYINSFGKLSVVVFILLFSARTLLIIFPYSIMAVLGGNLFGNIWGFVFSMISVFLSSTIAFYIGRLLGKDAVQKLVKGRIKELDTKVESHGFKIILIMRLSTVFPFDLLNYAAGLTKIKYREFILATTLGMLIETFSLSMLGGSLNHPFSKEFIISLSLVVLTVVIPLLYNNIIRRKQREIENDIQKLS